MNTRVDQISDRIYRISTCIPEAAPGGFTVNQFLVDAEEPLLYHTGMRQLFPLVMEVIERVMPVEQLRWISFAHVEADECGAVNEFLAVAPHAQVAHGELGCLVSLNDLCDRPPRPLADSEVLDSGTGNLPAPRRPRAHHARSDARLVVRRGLPGPAQGARERVRGTLRVRAGAAGQPAASPPAPGRLRSGGQR